MIYKVDGNGMYRNVCLFAIISEHRVKSDVKQACKYALASYKHSIWSILTDGICTAFIGKIAYSLSVKYNIKCFIV